MLVGALQGRAWRGAPGLVVRLQLGFRAVKLRVPFAACLLSCRPLCGWGLLFVFCRVACGGCLLGFLQLQFAFVPSEDLRAHSVSHIATSRPTGPQICAVGGGCF